MKADAVFEGGRVKGIGLVGALTVAEKEGYDEWVNITQLNETIRGKMKRLMKRLA